MAKFRFFARGGETWKPERGRCLSKGTKALSSEPSLLLNSQHLCHERGNSPVLPGVIFYMPGAGARLRSRLSSGLPFTRFLSQPASRSEQDNGSPHSRKRVYNGHFNPTGSSARLARHCTRAARSPGTRRECQGLIREPNFQFKSRAFP